MADQTPADAQDAEARERAEMDLRPGLERTTWYAYARDVLRLLGEKAALTKELERAKAATAYPGGAIDALRGQLDDALKQGEEYCLQLVKAEAERDEERLRESERWRKAGEAWDREVDEFRKPLGAEDGNQHQMYDWLTDAFLVGADSTKAERDALQAALDDHAAKMAGRPGMCCGQCASLIAIAEARVKELEARPFRTWDQTAADKLADEVESLIRTHKLDGRSPAADALLDYREPKEPTR